MTRKHFTAHSTSSKSATAKPAIAPATAKPEKPPCEKCAGSGTVNGKTCRTCDGKGSTFPLTINGCGYFSKKIKGHVHYFGPWSDGTEAALAKWNEKKEALLAGRDPESANQHPAGYTVRDLLGDYELFKRRLRDQERIDQRTYLDCKATCKLLAKHLDGWRLVSDLGPRDFTKIMDALMDAKRKGKKKSMLVLGNAISRIKSVFSYAKDEDKIEREVVFGLEFSKPPAKSIEKQKAEVIEADGQRTFTRDELLAILSAAGQPLKAMVLLGINCGLGNSDIGQLRRAHLNLEMGWLDYARPKTQCPRRGKLWPETVEAIKEWLAIRRTTASSSSRDMGPAGTRKTAKATTSRTTRCRTSSASCSMSWT